MITNQARNILIFGAGNSGTRLGSAIQTDPSTNLIGYVDDDKQKQGLYFHAVMFFLRVAALYYGLITSSVMMAIIALSCVNTLGRLFFICWLYKISGNKVSSFLFENIKAMCFSALCIVPLMLTLYFQPHLWFTGLFISSLVIGLRYLRLLKEAF